MYSFQGQLSRTVYIFIASWLNKSLLTEVFFRVLSYFVLKKLKALNLLSITGCSVSLLLAQRKPQRIRGFLYQGNRKMLFLIYPQQEKADMTC